MSSSAISTMPQKQDVQTLLARVGDRSLSTGQRINCVGDVMKAMSSKMMAALPKHVTPDRMIRVAINCIRKTPKLLDCDPASLFGAITEAATYGWELGGVLGHAYLVPFRRECTLIPGYKGLIDLCRRSGQISTVSLEVVHDGDMFDYSIGDTPHITHKPDDRNPKRHLKPITHAYAVVRLRDGGIQRGVWSREQIEAHKEQYSKGWQWAESGDKSKGGGKKDSPWHTAWPTMAKKTVIRDMIQRGLVPLSAEYRDLINRGVEYDDAGGLDIDSIDIIPTGRDEIEAIEGETETHDRPQTSPEPDEAYIASARARFADITLITNLTPLAKELCDNAPNDATRNAVDGLAITAEERIANSRGSRSNKSAKQGELV
jgi:recombination protein RecT